MVHFPTPLSPGGTIGIMSPSSYIEAERLAIGVSVLQQRGYKVKVHPQALLRSNQSAGTAAQKAEALYDLLEDPEVGAIMAATGGNRAALVLDILDFDRVSACAKPIMGFSDSTALLNGLYRCGHFVTFHGATVSYLSRLTPSALEATFSLLEGRGYALPGENLSSLVLGEAVGDFIGGTLSVFCSLVGTPYFPDPKGKILFLEDVNEELSRLDRMLWHVRRALPFSELAGVVFGQFSAAQDTGSRPFGFTLADILSEHTQDVNGPALMGAPFGHIDDLHPLPIGGRGKITAQGNNNSSIQVLI